MSNKLNKQFERDPRDEALALFGGPKVLAEPMPLYQSFGSEEKEAAMKVLESGVLSKFIGAWSNDFYGGEQVQAFERAWERAFNVRSAISVNSATSGLICALGALELEPGDEVILSPWTMSADAAAILVWNAIPVFADIEEETFNLCPDSILKKLSPRTKAILVSDIFGQAAKLDEIISLARDRGIKVIEDAAQAPGALYKGKFVGTIADIGVFSLNYHKHIHTGEGGVCVTNDPILAERMQLLRNHAESVVGKKGVADISNMIGFNFRLGEIEAAMGIEQLKKLPEIVRRKTRAMCKLTERLLAADLRGLQLPATEAGSTHVYYVYALRVNPQLLGVSRSTIAKALRAEGIPSVGEGYQNLHLLPMFQKRTAYGKSGFPWKLGNIESDVTYGPGLCPRAELYHAQTYMGLAPCSHRYNEDDVELVALAFEKVWRHLNELKGATAL